MPQTDLMESLYERWSAAFAEEPEMPLERWRAMVEEWPQVTAEPGSVDYVEVDAGGVPAMWITPKGAAEDRVILSIHGGGFVVGSMYTHRKLFGHLAKAVDARALAVDYRRPPEHLHPAAVEDVVSAYEWLLDEGIEPSHIAFTGDSAGGGMVVTAMLLARDRGLPLPAAGMRLSGASHVRILRERRLAFATAGLSRSSARCPPAARGSPSAVRVATPCVAAPTASRSGQLTADGRRSKSRRMRLSVSWSRASGQ